MEGDLESGRELVELEAGEVLALESDPTGRARLWEARHHVLFALVAASPGKLHKSTDVCVPVSHLGEAIRRARAAIGAYGFDATIVAHAGDGNYHVLFMLDPADPGERERAEALNADLVEWALAQAAAAPASTGSGWARSATWRASTAICCR